MRDRLLVAFVALTFGVVAVFLVERGYATAEVIHDQEERKVERSAAVVAGLVGASRVEVTEELLGSVLFDGEHAVYVDEAGRSVEAANHAAVDHVDKSGDIRVTVPVEGGGTLTVTRDAALVDERVADALLPLVARRARRLTHAETVGVAVTGAGPGVFRWAQAEQALRKKLVPAAVDGLSVDAEQMNEDMHGSREYRANLVKVMTRRAVAKL